MATIKIIYISLFLFFTITQVVSILTRPDLTYHADRSDPTFHPSRLNPKSSRTAQDDPTNHMTQADPSSHTMRPDSQVTRPDLASLEKVLEACWRVLTYYQDHVEEMNLDAVIGTRIAEGQFNLLRSALRSQRGHGVRVVQKAIQDLYELASSLNTIAQPLVMASQQQYYGEMGGLIARGLWEVPLSTLAVNASLASPRLAHDPTAVLQGVEQLREAQSDRCVAELLGSACKMKPRTKRSIPRGVYGPDGVASVRDIQPELVGENDGYERDMSVLTINKRGMSRAEEIDMGRVRNRGSRRVGYMGKNRDMKRGLGMALKNIIELEIIKEKLKNKLNNYNNKEYENINEEEIMYARELRGDEMEDYKENEEERVKYEGVEEGMINTYEEEDGEKYGRRECIPCSISQGCWDTMTRVGYSGYSLTHQAFYLTIAMQSGCEAEIASWARVLPGGGDGSVQGLVGRVCADVLQETLVLSDADLPDHLKDLFMEQGALCGLLGYRDFFTKAWLARVLAWQKPSGCFGDPEEWVSRRPSMHPPTHARVRREEKVMGEDCLAHMSAVAVGYLSLYARFMIDSLYL